MARRALARAHLGRGREALDEIGRCRRYLERWNPADSPEVLEIRFTEGCILRRDVQISAHYHEPRVYRMVRPLAAELALLGDAGPAEALRRRDG